MTRSQLIDALHGLAKEAQASDHLPAAGILFTLCGALVERREMELLGVTTEFSRERVEAQVDWGDDTLKL